VRGGPGGTTGDVRDLKTAEWEAKVLTASKPVAVDFWHETCVWCKRLEPEFEAIAAERSHAMDFYKVHVFQETDIAVRYGIQGTPTIKFFCGGREVAEIVGFRPRSGLRQEVDAVLARAEECLKQSTPMKAA